MPKHDDLLARARRLDEGALAEIYDRHSTELYYYAARLLGDAQLAEDCVAETFSRFLQALHRGGGPREHLRAYLYRVAHNWASDHYRSRQPQPSPLDMDTMIANEPGPAQTVQSHMEQERVRAALADLTPNQRQVIILKFLEGWSNDEVARSLRKPVGAVKSLQHRGLAALKRALIRAEERL